MLILVWKTDLVGDGGRSGADFKALRRQVPVGAGPLTGQLNTCALVLLDNLAQSKVLHAHHDLTMLATSTQYQSCLLGFDALTPPQQACSTQSSALGRASA